MIKKYRLNTIANTIAHILEKEEYVAPLTIVRMLQEMAHIAEEDPAELADE